jgi:hypothetical protein
MADSSSSGGQANGVPGAESPDDLGWAHTVTSGVTPGGGVAGLGSAPAAGPVQAGAVQAGAVQAGAVQAGAVQAGAVQAGGPAAAGAQQVVRHGPGVPAVTAGGQSTLTAEQVWQAGAPPRGRRARLIAGSALSIALLIASVVVIFLRLHHGPFGVTGVAITAQARNGCTVDVTGRISTTGAAGTVSYQWIFQRQQAAAQPLSQSAAAGQSAVYVTAAIQGQGHGSVTQTVTLRVLAPARGTASVPVTVSC